ncbi:hypothetical protein F441_13359 [Phytophthora nicotianae CJ01A1]|uniref:Uncharacterized protein n=2 Tax=Phytophthora nicotianae TaxID=4792 RepID=W2WL57_PHYNI|nr:hypothetical protein L916_13002 [Phytophthora nicotianae]ETP11107.1 hypothetical protein F441_13359 [Phytophthora nicotianae CJ01A1]
MLTIERNDTFGLILMREQRDLNRGSLSPTPCSIHHSYRKRFACQSIQG